MSKDQIDYEQRIDRSLVGSRGLVFGISNTNTGVSASSVVTLTSNRGASPPVLMNMCSAATMWVRVKNQGTFTMSVSVWEQNDPSASWTSVTSNDWERVREAPISITLLAGESLVVRDICFASVIRVVALDTGAGASGFKVEYEFRG